MDGTQRPWQGAHGHRVFPLFGNTFGLVHGFARDLDCVGVVDDPATDSVRIDGAYRFSFLSLVSYWEQKMAGIAYTSVALVQ